MIKVLQARRKRLSFFIANIKIFMLSFVVISLAGAFFSVSVFEYGGNSFKILEYVFSKSYSYGLLCELVYIVAGISSFIITVQRLRDMGCRMPKIISAIIMMLSFVSSFFTWIGGANLISIAIDLSLAIFFLVMLFTASEKRPE